MNTIAQVYIALAGAGLVLIASDRRMARAAALQAGPPIIGLVLAAVL